MVLVHGDTSTAFSAAEAAFLQNIPIAHVEAGLRTSKFETPWPEEGYRRQISRITTLHFAPTSKSATNLYEEGINKGIHVVGNSIVDSLNYIGKLPYSLQVKNFMRWVQNDQLVLVTCHRRESYGEPLKNLCNSLKTIANSNSYVRIVWPVHPNERVAEVVKELEHEKILLAPPLEYNDFVDILKRSNLVITDSGGVLEESAVLGKPILILREETERPEALKLDNARLVGHDFGELEYWVGEWLKSPPLCQSSDEFGVGDTGETIAEIINDYFS